MKSPHLAQNRDPLRENFARALVRHQVEITLAITRFDIRQAMPFFRQRPQGLRQHFEPVHFQSLLAGLGEETTSFHPDEIAEIEQPENLHRLRPEFLCLHVNLDSPRRVAQIEKVTLAHVAMRRDPARCAKLRAFGKFRPHLLNRAARLKALAKRRHATSAQRLELLAPQRDQFILFVHRVEAVSVAAGRRREPNVTGILRVNRFSRPSRRRFAMPSPHRSLPDGSTCRGFENAPMHFALSQGTSIVASVT